MALVYSLKVKENINLREKIIKVLERFKNSFKINELGNGIEIEEFNEDLGFIITCSDLYDYFELSEGKFYYHHSLSFHLNNNFDNIIAKKNLLLIVLELMQEVTSDLILVFNGEDIVLSKKNSSIIMDNSTGFWNYTDMINSFQRAFYKSVII